METLENLITNLSGFKISNSHFRIGSKLHISDFYYAKRFFQNGFFSSRIAFLLAKDIIAIIEKEDRVENVKRNGLTIIGYEMYSELLITIVDKFLRKKWELDERKINHTLYEDNFENLKLCKQNNILGNVVIIVPIASTFSTSIKIENQILKDQKERNEKPYIFKPHLNVLWVSDGIPTNEPTDNERAFSFKNKDIDEKSIDVEAIYSEEPETTRTQKYYLTLPTKWHNVEDCQLCNPILIEDNQEVEKLEEEFPLYETDRTAVTPAIIFDFPKGRKIDDIDEKRKIKMDTRIVTYGHHTRSSHSLFSIDTELFFEKNKDDLQKWLMEIRKSQEFQNTYKETNRVIIVSTCHYSNAAFINLLNDYLFASTANIIHYDPSNDYVQNFKIVYGKEMNDADRIFFVDDSLKSGSAFDRIYHFVQNTVGFLSGEKSNKGISGCFFMLNASQPYSFNNLKTKLINAKLIYAFANLHLNSSLKPSDTSTIQIEQQRYEKLRNNSFVDSLKVHFLKQFNKLAQHENNPKEIAIGGKANRHLAMLIATHRIYQYFTVESKPNLATFYQFLTDLLLKTKSPIEVGKSLKEIDSLNGDDTLAYLKVITQAPFTQYKPLKDQVFKWVIQLLIKHINDTEQAILDDNFDYNFFNTLKFLIRRAGLLNANILISRTLIDFLPKLYSPNGIPRLIENLDSQKKISEDKPDDLFSRPISEIDAEIFKLNNFHVFFVAQIKELLLRNETRCLRLEKILKTIESDTNSRIQQIVRILREENSLIIKVFYEHISSQAGWGKIYLQDNDDENLKKAIDYTNDKIGDFLNQSSISLHHKFQTLNKYFQIINQPDVHDNKNLLNYLWLQYFLTTDKDMEQSLSIKTGYVLKKLMQLFVDIGIDKTGAFFIVNDSRKNPFVAFNNKYDGASEIEDEKLKIIKPYINYLDEFFWGEDNSSKSEKDYKHSKSVIELKRNESGDWIDLFATSGSAVVKKLDKDFISNEYNRLVLIRINKLSSEESSDKTQGIIGFYYNCESEDIIDINIIRYLLLLRPQLSEFIKKHHENDEFRDWQIAEIKQRTSLLTGHGREMLIDVALKRGDTYKKIVQTLLLVQRFLIDKKEESETLKVESSRVNKIFEGFFQAKDVQVDSSFFKNDLKEMAEEIFKFDEIEIKEDLEEPEINVPENIVFRFDKDLLRMICFEILVNAKKNRWIFANEAISDTKGNKYEKNKVWIKVNQNLDKLIVKISNTGPVLSEVELKKVNGKKNIKNYDNSSGIELIHTVLTEFDLGEIKFSQDVIHDRFSKFIATITLKQNSNGT
jgi:hypothetical protein